jgi:hypothetical protein
VALSRAQANSLIEDAGVDPDLGFKLFDLPQHFGFQIAQQKSGSAFSLDGATRASRYEPSAWFGTKRVGTDPTQDWEVEANDWQGVLENVRLWIQEIAQYEDTPDLWELYRSGLRSSFELATDYTPFTAEEQAEVDAGLDQVMAKLAEMSERLDLTAADVRDIKETVDELKDANKRLGKKDFKLVLIGQAATYAGPVARVFLGMLLRGVGHMLGLPPPPPSLPM